MNLRVPIRARRFAAALLDHDLPALPAERRASVLTFVDSRLQALPSPMSVGVGAVAFVVEGVGAVVGRERLARELGRRPVPVVRDYVRLLRSLALAYVWETWPSTRPDGSDVMQRSPATQAVAGRSSAGAPSLASGLEALDDQ